MHSNKEEHSQSTDLNALIAKVSQITDDSFIYLTYTVPKSSEHFTPYNLQEVDYTHVDKTQFYTMSRYGVTFWSHQEKYFTKLSIWQNEYNFYCRLTAVSKRSIA